ncbi:MAG: Fic family protein, partial [Treponemataceae bacterium]|nr:Fic family protein [Treponemataceae bacterium]
YRKDGVGNFDGNQVVHLAPPTDRVPALMADLFSWLKTTDVHPLIKSCVFHYEFEFIHPFQDGNGRIGRLWQTAILKEWKEVFAWIPVESLIKENQAEYYNVLNSSDNNADSTTFIEFMLSLLLKTIEEIIETEKKGTVKVTPKVTVNQQKILEAIKENPFVTQEELSQIIGISRKSIIQNMKKLQENGLIKRVGADKNGCWEI